MQLYEIGQSVARRRAELDLTQAQLAKLSGLSRFTVNQLETGKVKDLGINKLIPLLTVLGIELTASPRPEQKGLIRASVGANVSYKGKLTEARLARAFATGNIPAGYEPQVSVILDEVPVLRRRPDRRASRTRRSGKISRRGPKTCISTAGCGSDDCSLASFATGRALEKPAWPRAYAHR
jgi:transcriptional regulator with XRE-family HTH domain